MKIGFIVVRIAPAEEELRYFDQRSTLVLHRTPALSNSRFVVASLCLTAGKYAVILLTENAGDSGPCKLKVYTDAELVIWQTPGYKRILRKEEVRDVLVHKQSKEELVQYLNNRFYPGGASKKAEAAFNRALGSKNSMRVRGRGDTEEEKTTGAVIRSSKWASSLLVPFSLDEMVNGGRSEKSGGAAARMKEQNRRGGSEGGPPSNSLRKKFVQLCADVKEEKEEDFFGKQELEELEEYEKNRILLGVDEMEEQAETRERKSSAAAKGVEEEAAAMVSD